ncbi:MAG: hypothetical protein IJF43_01095, partial [Firmicutes bacterium]|nr:hypothetical protein [Bacillota bacterium]
LLICCGCSKSELNKTEYAELNFHMIDNYAKNKNAGIDTKLYIEGIITETTQFNQEAFTYNAFVIFWNDKPCIVSIDNDMISYTSPIEELIGKDVTVFGTFWQIANDENYGNMPMINFEELIINGSSKTITKEGLNKYYTEELKIDKNIKNQIENICKIEKIMAYVMIDKETERSSEPTLSIDLSTNSAKDYIDIAEEILALNELKEYDSIIIRNTKISGMIDYYWDSNNQRYASICTDFTDTKEIEKEYYDNEFFYKIDHSTQRENDLYEIMGKFYSSY